MTVVRYSVKRSERGVYVAIKVGPNLGTKRWRLRKAETLQPGPVQRPKPGPNPPRR